MNRTAIVLLLFCMALLMLFAPGASAGSPALVPARVTAVNDGDTLTINMNGKQYRTRLIGIDAPEHGQEPWGERARKHLRKLLKDLHWHVFIETDIEHYDKYHRLLIYVWDDKSRMINEEMIAAGYAVLFTIQPNSRHADRFIKAQRTAREKKIGIWGADGLKERPLEYKKRNPRK